MASDRAKLVLDEQAFQGLLAAAYTIQEHNARMTGDEPASGEAEARQPVQADSSQGISDPGEVKSVLPQINAEPLNTCSHCGAPLPTADAACPKCSVSSYRPGERLQRNWASLWQMSQEQGVETRRKPGSNPPLSPADPGRPRSNTVDSGEGVRSTSSPSDVAQPLAHRQANEDDFSAEDRFPQRSPEFFKDDRLHHGLSPKVEWPVESMPVESMSAEAPSVESIDLTSGIELADSSEALDYNEDAGDYGDHSPRDEATWIEGDDVSSSGRTLRNLRVKLHFRRADLFLGLAIIVAAVALLWPTPGGQKSKLPPWERALIAMGIAEAPAQVVHFHGDPNLKVWVDTHTALYYCPGDELYGKSRDGRFTTQREAQMERFEPAERSVCIQ